MWLDWLLWFGGRLRLLRRCNRLCRNGLIGIKEIGKFHQSHFDKKTFVRSVAEAVFGIGGNLKIFENQLQTALLRLLDKFGTGVVANLQKACGGRVERDKQVTKVLGKSGNEMLATEAFFNYLLIQQQTVGNIASPEIVHKTEIVLAVEHVEVFDTAFVCEVAVAEINQLVEHRKRIAQAALGFLGYNMQGFRLIGNTFLRRHILQMFGYILDFDAFEIENLATRQNCGYYLVFLGGGKYKFGVRRRLLQSFEECVESLL